MVITNYVCYKTLGSRCYHTTTHLNSIFHILESINTLVNTYDTSAHFWWYTNVTIYACILIQNF